MRIRTMVGPFRQSEKNGQQDFPEQGDVFLLLFMHTAPRFLLSFLSCNRNNDLGAGPCAVPGQLITHQVIYFLVLSSTRTIILQVNRGASKSRTEHKLMGEQLIKHLYNLELYSTSHPKGSPSTRSTDVCAATQPLHMSFSTPFPQGGVMFIALVIQLPSKLQSWVRQEAKKGNFHFLVLLGSKNQLPSRNSAAVRK